MFTGEEIGAQKEVTPVESQVSKAELEILTKKKKKKIYSTPPPNNP